MTFSVASIEDHMVVVVSPIYIGTPKILSKILTTTMSMFGNSKINIQTDKPFYTSGELVTGKIYLQATSALNIASVVLKASGKEKVSWEEERTRTVGEGEDAHTERYDVEFDEKKHFFKESVVVSNFTGGLPPGNYIYPFQYQLPADLPGSFAYKNKRPGGNVKDVKAFIGYKFKATVDVQGMFSRDLKDKQDVLVYAKLWESVVPSTDHKTATVRLCCCIPRGECHMTATLDKNAYFVDDTVNVLATVNNESESDVGKLNVKLMQVLSMHADGRNTRLVNTVAEASFPGVPSHQATENQPLALRLDGITPGSEGRYIKCTYHIDVECDIAWAPDIELHMPVEIIAPQPAVWGTAPADITLYMAQPAVNNVPVAMAVGETKQG